MQRIPANSAITSATVATGPAPGVLNGTLLLFSAAYHRLTGRRLLDPGPATPPAASVRPELGDLLGLGLEPESSTGAPDHSRFQVGMARRQAPLQGRAGVLAPLQALATQWLEAPRMAQQLASVGLAVEDVRRHLAINVRSFEQGLPARHWNGRRHSLIDFPALPYPHDLLSYAVLDAQQEQAFLALQAAVAREAARPAPATDAGVPGPGIDPARRRAALQAVQDFGAAVPRELQQLGSPTSQGFWGLSRGRVTLRELDLALAVVPCASFFRPATGGGLHVSYPQTPGEVQRLRIVRVRDLGEVYFARGTVPNRVRYSLDRGRSWNETGHYTDDRVEAAKWRLWSAIVAVNQQAQARYLSTRAWMGWSA